MSTPSDPRSPAPSEGICAHCYEPASKHLLANYADGPHVGQNVLICPRSTFVQAIDRSQWRENPPHETSDRTMRRAGSPPR